MPGIRNYFSLKQQRKVWTFRIEIDGQEPVRLTCSVLKQLVKPLQVHIATDLLMNLLQLILVLELEEAQERAVLADGSW